MDITLSVLNSMGVVLHTQTNQDLLHTVYPQEYQPGDAIHLLAAPGFYDVGFEDTMPKALVYIPTGKAVFQIPPQADRNAYNPRSFHGANHLLTVEKASEEAIYARRNLAFNPYDAHGDTGMFPHAKANVETRNEALFAARNAIDGVHANTLHSYWPYTSWGINRNPDAELKVDFGHPVDLDSIIITLRADFPHDNHWAQGTLSFSDGSEQTVQFTKTAQPQRFEVQKNTVTWVNLSRLIPSDDPSPFPALRQIVAWGRVHKG